MTKKVPSLKGIFFATCQFNQIKFLTYWSPFKSALIQNWLVQKLVWWMIFLSYCCSQTILTLQEAWVSRFKSRELLLIQIIYDWSIQKQTDVWQSPGEYFVFLAWTGAGGRRRVRCRAPPRCLEDPLLPSHCHCQCFVCDLVLRLWCFIFVFHEEQRKYNEYPEYRVQNVKILETKISISFMYRMKLCWKRWDS